MFTIIIIGAIIAAYLLLRVLDNQSFWWLSVVAVVVVALTVCVSGWSADASAANLPDGYERITCYYADGNKIAEKTIIRCEKEYLSVGGPGLAFLVPGASYHWSIYDPSGAYCESCDILCELPNCVLCGTEMGVGCNHKGSIDMPYCGFCGEHLNTEGN